MSPEYVIVSVAEYTALKQELAMWQELYIPTEDEIAKQSEVQHAISR